MSHIDVHSSDQVMNHHGQPLEKLNSSKTKSTEHPVKQHDSSTT
jgi:hypothetical protein